MNQRFDTRKENKNKKLDDSTIRKYWILIFFLIKSIIQTQPKKEKIQKQIQINQLKTIALA